MWYEFRCMYVCILWKCSICETKVPNINEFDDSSTTYKQCTVKKENKLMHGKQIEIRRSVKSEIFITKKTLLMKFLEAIDKVLVYQYSITHQYIKLLPH